MQGICYIGLPLEDPDEVTDKGLTGDLADDRPNASNRDPAGGMYSIDFSGYNMDGPSSEEVVAVIEGGSFIAASLGDGDMTPKESIVDNRGWEKREPLSEELV